MASLPLKTLEARRFHRSYAFAGKSMAASDIYRCVQTIVRAAAKESGTSPLEDFERNTPLGNLPEFDSRFFQA